MQSSTSSNLTSSELCNSNYAKQLRLLDSTTPLSPEAGPDDDLTDLELVICSEYRANLKYSFKTSRDSHLPEQMSPLTTKNSFEQ
jgi:hypothetical protein